MLGFSEQTFEMVMCFFSHLLNQIKSYAIQKESFTNNVNAGNRLFVWVIIEYLDDVVERMEDGKNWTDFQVACIHQLPSYQ